MQSVHNFIVHTSTELVYNKKNIKTMQKKITDITQKDTALFSALKAGKGKAVAFVLFEEDTVRIVITGARQSMQVIFSPVDISLVTQSVSTRVRGTSVKQKNSEALKREIGIFIYDTFRRYVKRHSGVHIACAIVGADFSRCAVFAGFLEKEVKVPMIVKSLASACHLLEISLVRLQSDRSKKPTRGINASLYPRRMAHIIIPLLSIGIGSFFIILSLAVLGWYFFSPSGMKEKANDILIFGNHIERTFHIDFTHNGSARESDTIAGKQIFLTQKKTIPILPTGTETVRYPLSGVITVANDSCKDIALRDHTRFSGANGVVVRTLEGVTVGARQSKDVSVIADASDAEELPAGRLAIVMFDNTVLDQTVYGFLNAPLFRAVPEVKNTLTEEDIERARRELRIDLKKMLLEQVDWQRFVSVDTGAISLIHERVDSVNAEDSLEYRQPTLTATGRLLVSLVEKQDIEHMIQTKSAEAGFQMEVISWEVKNFSYLPDTTKGIITVKAFVKEKKKE